MAIRRFVVYTIVADIVILSVSFILMILLKPAGLMSYIPSHLSFFIFLALIWIVISLANGKIGRGRIVNLKILLYKVLSSNVVAISISALLMYTIRDYTYSRTVVLGTALTATILEFIAGSVWMAFQKATIQMPEPLSLSEREMVARSHPEKKNGYEPDPALIARLESGCKPECAHILASMISPEESSRLSVVSTSDSFNITNLAIGGYSCIINLRPINNIRNIDTFFDKVNDRLTDQGIHLCMVETLEQRSRRLRKKYTSVLYGLFFPFDFLYRRVVPRLTLTKGIWKILTRGANPPLSRAETLGRLCRAGFAIKLEKFVGNMLCIKAERISEPLPVNGSGNGMIIALPRVGLNGKIFNVYKLRTMHPYSEFIQNYVYDLHDLQAGGKLRHDFRITSWGHFCRRIWLDELPMIANLLKGDMKIVGVRPLSSHYFNLYSKELRQRRIQYKPGLLPPFYADMPTDLKGIQHSEKRYLDQWNCHPVRTDLKYFFKSLFNILFRNARSN